MNKITILLLTGIVASSAPAQANQLSSSGYFVGIAGGPFKSHIKFRPTIKHGSIRSYGGELKGGYMGNFGYFFYGLEANIGYANGDTTITSNGATFKINQGLNNDLVAKLGMKTGRSTTYALVGLGWEQYKVKSTSSARGRETKKTYGMGPVFGGGITYDVLPKFTVLVEYKHAKYEDSTVPKTLPALKMKPDVDKVYFGLIYKI